jgi:transcriptional regulator of acetoin/glycerol metabolism
MTETRTRVLHWFVSGGVAKTPEGGQFTIDVDPLVIGRDPGANIVLADPEVSAFHCELRAVGEGILVKDLGSTNGTFLGAVRVREAIVATPSELTAGQSRVLIEPQAKRRVEVGYSDRFGPLVGNSPKMRRVFGILEKVSNTPLSVLLLGETGTGKELVAKAIHDASDQKGGAFVVVDCGSIPPTLAESILFGHEKGSFTGATERRKGALAEADGGTLFLDELGELPVELQPKLLRALSEKQVKRVGGNAFEPIEVRVVAATRRDLGAEMNAGRSFPRCESGWPISRSSWRTSASAWANRSTCRRCSPGSSSAWPRTTGRATCASS